MIDMSSHEWRHGSTAPPIRADLLGQGGGGPSLIRGLVVTLWFCRWCHNLWPDLHLLCGVLIPAIFLPFRRRRPTPVRFPLCPFPFRLPRFRLADAGEISLQLGYDHELPIGNHPPESQLRPLKSVPESVRKEIWDEAIQHATNCGLMLLQVKASLNHGEWLPWLKQQQESGAIGFSHKTATKYMNLAANMNRGSYLSEAPSIRAALELLSDKEPTEQQGELAGVEVERQARQEAEAKAESERQARLTAEQRSEDWRQQSNGQRKKIRDLESQIDLLQARPAEPVTVIPDDYEALKQAKQDLQFDLADLRQKQRELVQQQVAEKLRERESELEEIDQKVRAAAARLEGLQRQIDRYTLRQREASPSPPPSPTRTRSAAGGVRARQQATTCIGAMPTIAYACPRLMHRVGTLWHCSI